MQSYKPSLKQVSRKLREGMTEAEARLWSHLRGKQILGIQFYRQKPIGPYVTDFYAHAVQMVVEVDGSQHLEPAHAELDRQRDLYLEKQGILVLRFDDRQVLLETDGVLEEIFCRCRERLNPP